MVRVVHPVPVVSAPVTGPGLVPISLKVNGKIQQIQAEPRRSLLDVIRWDLGLTGAKRVCNLGECGACTVLADGRPIYACLALAIECEAVDILTIEGLAVDGQLDPVQQAFIRHDAVQCGFCTPGQVLAAKALISDNAQPSDEDIDRAMCGNLCRCGTYTHVRNALQELRQNSPGGAR